MTERHFSGDAADRNDLKNWIGPVYSNADDPNLFVSRRFGIGRTVNVSRPLGKVILIALILLVLCAVCALVIVLLSS
jgi:uncharacterized membrane protein